MLVMLALVVFTVLANTSAVRFDRVAPALITIEAEHAPIDVLPTPIRLLLEPEPDGLRLSQSDDRWGRIRWEPQLTSDVDRLQVSGRVSVEDAGANQAIRHQARLVLVQPTDNRPLRRLIAGWPESVAQHQFDRIIRIMDPERPLWIDLILTPSSGTLVLHRLTVDGLATRLWVEAARWILLACWIGSILAILWHLSRPMPRPLQLSLWLVASALFIGLLASPEQLATLKDLLAALLPTDTEAAASLDVNLLGHFALFAALALVLFLGRADLGWLRLALVLAAMASATELMQLLVDGRQADPFDVLVDLVGAATGMLAGWFILQIGWLHRTG